MLEKEVAPLLFLPISGADGLGVRLTLSSSGRCPPSGLGGSSSSRIRQDSNPPRLKSYAGLYLIASSETVMVMRLVEHSPSPKEVSSDSWVGIKES